MAKWEYQSVKGPAVDNSALVELLNQHGAEAWELVTLHLIPTGIESTPYSWLIFKRELR